MYVTELGSISFGVVKSRGANIGLTSNSSLFFIQVTSSSSAV
jgi:hypothetical protein